MIAFSNPRLVAEFSDWPLGGSKRGACRFWVESHPTRGVRVGRATTGKPKYTTFGGAACIVDGSDGRTYILRHAGRPYRFITIYRSDFLCASKDDIGRDHSVFEDGEKSLHEELTALIASAK